MHMKKMDKIAYGIQYMLYTINHVSGKFCFRW